MENEKPWNKVVKVTLLYLRYLDKNISSSLEICFFTALFPFSFPPPSTLRPAGSAGRRTERSVFELVEPAAAIDYD